MTQNNFENQAIDNLNNNNQCLQTTDLSELVARFDAIKAQIAPCVRLLCVSKTKPGAMIRALYDRGQSDFGENYLQEAQTKMVQLEDCAIVWHYIGHIQRNKTKQIAQSFDWVHTVERQIIAERLNEQRQGLAPLNVLIQINIDDEISKSGCRIEDVSALVQSIAPLPNLVLRGLMIIPSPTHTDAFARTKALFDDIKRKHDLLHWDTLSMGMSGDMAEAISAGSTMVRVGSAIFGARS